MDDIRFCSHCHLELFPDEWFICSQCRYEDENERVLGWHQLCARIAFGEMPELKAAWKIG